MTAPVLLLALAAGAAGVPVEGAALQEATIVTVSSFSYSPDPVEIRSGASIRWRWQGDDRHSVTAYDGSFDSDPTCEDNELLRENCRTGGDEDFVWTAPEVSERMEIPYRCKLHASSQGMTGTVVVLPPPPEPSPSESSPPESPSPSPTRSPSPSASPAPSGGQGDADDDTEDDPPPPRGPQRGAPPPVGTGSGSEASAPPVAAPEVAAPVDEPDLEPFPSPAPIPSDPETEEEDLGEVAVDLPADDDDRLRTALLGVAAASVAGTAIAFGKLVLFGPRWR